MRVVSPRHGRLSRRRKPGFGPSFASRRWQKVHFGTGPHDPETTGPGPRTGSFDMTESLHRRSPSVRVSNYEAEATQKLCRPPVVPQGHDIENQNGVLVWTQPHGAAVHARRLQL